MKCDPSVVKVMQARESSCVVIREGKIQSNALASQTRILVHGVKGNYPANSRTLFNDTPPRRRVRDDASNMTNGLRKPSGRYCTLDNNPTAIVYSFK